MGGISTNYGNQRLEKHPQCCTVSSHTERVWADSPAWGTQLLTHHGAHLPPATLHQLLPSLLLFPWLFFTIPPNMMHPPTPPPLHPPKLKSALLFVHVSLLFALVRHSEDAARRPFHSVGLFASSHLCFPSQASIRRAQPADSCSQRSVNKYINIRLWCHRAARSHANITHLD